MHLALGLIRLFTKSQEISPRGSEHTRKELLAQTKMFPHTEPQSPDTIVTGTLGNEFRLLDETHKGGW